MVDMAESGSVRINVGEAKKTFSDLLSRVAYRGETIIITRRGRPMARLVPAASAEDAENLAHVRGWLDADDPYFGLVETIVAGRSRHVPRIMRTTKRRRGSRSK